MQKAGRKEQVKLMTGKSAAKKDIIEGEKKEKNEKDEDKRR